MKLTIFSTLFVLAVSVNAAALGRRDAADFTDALARCNEDCARQENVCLGDANRDQNRHDQRQDQQCRDSYGTYSLAWSH